MKRITMIAINICLALFVMRHLPVVVTQSFSDAETVFNVIKNVSTSLRPVLNQSHTMQVSVIFNLNAITEVNEVRQELTCNGWLNLSWTDEVRTWDASQHGGLDLLQMGPTDLWRPRVMISNSLQERDIFKDDNAPLFLFSDGRVRWYPGSIFFTSCKMIMTMFPFDTQKCQISFLSTNYYVKHIHFTPALTKVRTAAFSANGEWTLDDSEVESLLIPVSDEIFTGFQVTLTLSRRPAFFLLNVVLPVMLLSLLNFLVFVLPDRCGEKVTFGTTILLSQAVYMSVVMNLLPQNSDSIPLVLIYLFCVLVLSSVAVGVSIIVVAYDNMKDNQKQLDETEASSFNDTDMKNGITFVNKVYPIDQKTTEGGDDIPLSQVKDANRKCSGFSLQAVGGCFCKGRVLFSIFFTLWLLLSLCFLLYLLHGERDD